MQSSPRLRPCHTARLPTAAGPGISCARDRGDQRARKVVRNRLVLPLDLSKCQGQLYLWFGSPQRDTAQAGGNRPDDFLATAHQRFTKVNVFDDDPDDGTDKLAWELVQTPEFQRLRRIKQLGVSEFVFPGASHSRFAHSLGVYRNAKRLLEVVQQLLGKEEAQKQENVRRAKVVRIAALLHDIGHGPFSHAFERAREAIAKARDAGPVHGYEEFTSKLIVDHAGQIKPLLDGVDRDFAREVSELIAAENPKDLYHAIVSSSFDEDKLDYLVRDRYMTGTETGSIDYDWLINSLDTYDVDIAPDNDEPPYVKTVAFKLKGRQAAEDFLLARYRLYAQVYFHKTTRGIEKLVSALVRRIGEVAGKGARRGSLDLDRITP